MHELRQDPFLLRWVILSDERARRPLPPVRIPRLPAVDPRFCPFCPGNESQTPDPIRSLPLPGEGGSWQVRVVPNLYPMLRVEVPLERSAEGPLDRVSGVGAHEVVIHSPRHTGTLPELSAAEVELLLLAWAERSQDLKRDGRMRHVQIFQNHGLLAGATVEHPHSQVVGLPVVPRRTVEGLTVALDHHARTERCLTCDVLHHEESHSARVVAADRHFVAICPYAARSPFELTILPRRHRADFESVDADERRSLARLLRDGLRRLRLLLDDPSYSLGIVNAPAPEARRHRQRSWEAVPDAFHWRIELTPRLTPVAGLEWATEVFVNSTTPEESARLLRSLPDAETS